MEEPRVKRGTFNGLALVEWRLGMGKTQREMAKMHRVSAATWGRWEGGDCPKPGNLKTICDESKKPLSFFLTIDVGIPATKGAD